MMSYGDRKDDNERLRKIRIENTDTYDQALMEIKHLVNEMRAASKEHWIPYRLAMAAHITNLKQAGPELLGYSEEQVDDDIRNALRGGKYRRLTKDASFEEDRKKKSSKPKPKRKVKCKCK
jgi:hypothetical protein